MSSHAQETDLDRQVSRLTEWAGGADGGAVVRVEAEVGSGMNGSRPKVRRLLSDPKVIAVIEAQDLGAREQLSRGLTPR